MAAASAAGSRGSTRTPVTPSSTTDASPPTRVATTGRPTASASSATNPNGSSQREGTIPIAQCLNAAITSAWGTCCAAPSLSASARLACHRHAEDHERRRVDEPLVGLEEVLGPLVRAEAADVEEVAVASGRNDGRATGRPARRGRPR